MVFPRREVARREVDLQEGVKDLHREVAQDPLAVGLVEAPLVFGEAGTLAWCRGYSSFLRNLFHFSLKAICPSSQYPRPKVQAN